MPDEEDDFFEEDEPVEEIIRAWNDARKIWVDFEQVTSRKGSYFVGSLMRFAAVAKNIVPGARVIAVDHELTEAQATVVSVSDEGFVQLRLDSWAPRGTGWCAPSP